MKISKQGIELSQREFIAAVAVNFIVTICVTLIIFG